MAHRKNWSIPEGEIIPMAVDFEILLKDRLEIEDTPVERGKSEERWLEGDAGEGLTINAFGSSPPPMGLYEPILASHPKADGKKLTPPTYPLSRAEKAALREKSEKEANMLRGRRKRRRFEQDEQNDDARLNLIKEVFLTRHVDNSMHLAADGIMEDAPVARSGYIGLNPNVSRKKRALPEDFDDEGADSGGVDVEAGLRSEGVGRGGHINSTHTSCSGAGIGLESTTPTGDAPNQPPAEEPASRRIYTLDELLEGKAGRYFTRVKWDGRKRICLTDSKGRTIVVLVGRPAPYASWDAVNRDACEALDDARERCIMDADLEHRRGTYASLQTGFSYGGGQVKPTKLHNGNVINDEIVEGLNRQSCFKRVAKFTSSCLNHAAPNLFGHYKAYMNNLQVKSPDLKRPFSGCVFPAATYNLGPQNCCLPHFDFANLPYGWCAIVSFGDYDHEKGGHIVLWDLGLIIEFPPGSVIFIPSSVVEHSNTPVSKNERRYSFTQYAAGSLFRWVDYGFRSEARYKKTMSSEAWKGVKNAQRQSWEENLKLLPMLSEDVLKSLGLFPEAP